jgi:uncharacterized membrane protein (DUF4010 family)
MIDTMLLFKFGAALFIGVLTGLQREFASEEEHREVVAGVRTFALMGLAGCAAAFLCERLASPWPFVGTILVIGAFVSINHYFDVAQGQRGLTTKISAIMVVLTGGLAYWNPSLAVAIGVAATVLLSIKPELHRFVEHLTKADIIATLKFAVITAIILPVLPNKVYGPPPFDIFNPLKIWLLVVFISGISFVGYVLIKMAGAKRGIGLTGFLGGMVSSTAVTLSFTQKSKKAADLSRQFGLAIVIAWTVMYARVLVVVAVFNFSLMSYLWLPMVASMSASLLYCFYLSKSQKASDGHGEMSFSNPFELGPAITFGLLFIVILFIAKVAQVYLGNTGIYLSSFISGFVDVDAVALSLAKLSRESFDLTPKIAAQAIVLASVANTIVKGLIAVIGGTAGLRKAIIPGALLMIAVGVAVVFLV